MNLRPAVEADLEALAQVHGAAFEPGWDAEQIADIGSGPGAYALIVETDRPIGMILCRAVAGEAEILTLAVEPAARRGGVGAALVEAAAGLARTAGADAMFLEVGLDNPGAIALYERAGFVRAGRRKGYYERAGGVRVDALVMRRDLNTEGESPYSR